MNVDASSTAAVVVGGLVGYVLANAGPSEIRRVHVTGRVASAGASSYVGGIVGAAESLALADSWSSVDVKGGQAVGGAVGYAFGSTLTVSRVHATGPVTCTDSCNVGGLIGIIYSGTVDLSYATGPVTAGISYAGGLVGFANGSTIRRSHALGAVTIGAAPSAGGGLIGVLQSGTLAQVYAAGRVTGEAGAMVGGLVGQTVGANAVASAFWDTATSKQTASAAGTGYTTGQLRNVLPSGFGNAWAITRKRSYPFLDDADIDFAAPLATLVKSKRVFTFLPIDQHDTSQYAGGATGANGASLAAAYTMIARAIGITRSVVKLKDVTIDKYFWNDATRTTTWQGPVTTRATLGTFTATATNAPLNDSNVIGAMKSGQLVLLRGTYTKGNGANAKHWLLGTLYTTFGNAVGAVIANDPWTGLQVMIDPVTRTVAWPADYPLANFRIDGYQPVSLN